jgi:hypothetical protein
MFYFGVLLALVGGFAFFATRAQTQDQIIGGTINVVLANSNGMVVLTDSKQTVMRSAGQPRSTQEAQKLIRLDDHSVCAIAGFGGAQFSAPRFNVNVMGILSDFRDELAVKKGHLSFDHKLRALSFLLRLYIESFANIDEVGHPGVLKDAQLAFSLFLVGYDSDGKPKIGSRGLNAAPHVLPSGNTGWQISEKIQVNAVRNGLQCALAGMIDVGAKIMKNPQAYPQSPAIRRLSEPTADNGVALQVTDLEALAKFIAAETSKKYPDLVGGPDQVAIFRNSEIIKFEQRSFPLPPKPIPLNLIMDVPLQFGPGGGIVAPNGVTTIWIRNTIVGNQALMLDGSFFLGNEIRDSVVTYDGDPTVFFDASNKLINSRLQLGENFGSNMEFVRYLVRSFPWSQCPPFRCNNQ